MATSAGLVSSSGIHQIPPGEIKAVGLGLETNYHVEQIYQLIGNGQKDNSFFADAADWIQLGENLNCREAVAVPSFVFQPLLPK